MVYSEFTLESALRELNLTLGEADLFAGQQPITPPAWLADTLARGTRLALISEKSRSEFIVVPILLTARELSKDRFAIFSGQRLDIDASRGLAGECDFLLSIGPSLPPLHDPIAAIVEAKKNDVESGLGQCVAQLVAANEFNQQAGRMTRTLYGCVTTGEAWQFLKLNGQRVELAKKRYYLDDVPGILGSWVAVVA